MASNLSRALAEQQARAAIEQEGVYGLYQEFQQYISETLNPIFNDFNKVKEKTEILDGSRSRGASNKAAVRYEDLRALDRFPTRPPNYRYLGAAPSADDYNKLAADVKKLYEVVGTLASMLSNKL